MVKSYIKIYGPPNIEAVHALERIAVDMPEVTIYDHVISASPLIAYDSDAFQEYFNSIPIEIPLARRSNIISESGVTLGEYDFFFEWAKAPSWKDVENLVKKIDEALKPVGCRYTITTK